MSQSSQSAEAARTAHKWLVASGLYRNIIDSAGEHDSKIKTEENTSLAAHILNAVAVAVNSFVYEAFSPEDDIEDYEEDLRVLAAATALHDTNKFVQEAYGFNTAGNTEEAFAIYFGEHDEVDNEADEFGIESDFLDSGYRDDLLYIVQRCEISEDSTESRRTETEFRGLERYCRIGDQVASIAQREGVRGVSQKLTEKFGEEDVHLLKFNALEQPVLNDLLIGSIKQAIAGEDDGDVFGVPIGSTADAVVYLGEETHEDELESRAAEVVPKRVREFGFSCKLNWNSFDYDILSEVAIPVEDKEKIIAEEFRDLLHDGTAGVEGFEHIPKEFDQYFPVLAKAIYIDGRDEFDKSEVQSEYDRLYEWSNQKVKIHFIAYLIENFKRNEEFLWELSDEVRPELHEELEPDSDVISTAVGRFFGSSDVRPLAEKEQMCFLCGSIADKPYEKGHETVYQSQGFSRRLPPYRGKSSSGKSICGVCDFEYSLVFDICNKSGMNLDRNRPGSRKMGVSIAYMYFDDFLGDVRLRENRMGIELGETIDLADPTILTNLLQPQYYIQPFSFGDHPQMGEKNHRMVAVRQLMRAAQESGMKVVIGTPITRFESADSIFTDQGATRPQELLELDELERFGPLPSFADEELRTDSHLQRALALFDIMGKIGGIADMTNQYLALDQDRFHDIAHLAVSRAVKPGSGNKPSRPAYLPEVVHNYLQTYHNNELMQMKTVAERGIDLFGKQYDSKYKKTKIFREALDAFLSGKNQNMPDDRLVEYVESQVYTAADREDYAGRATTEQAEAFVEAIRSYLVENDLYDLKKLSDWEDALVNSYYYAYDQLLYDDQ